MLDSIPVMLIVGTALGVLAGLGVGGGSILILWLTLILHMPQQQARSINLLFFLPSAIIACLFRWRQGTLDFKKVLPAVIAGCVSAGLLSVIAATVDTEALRKPFGMILLVTGIREVLYRPRKAR